MDSEHYFDWAATTPPDMDIITQANNEAAAAWGNPSSAHSAGKEARTLLEKARVECANSLGVKANTIYFTSGGTESSHIVLLSELNRPLKGTVLISAMEHSAVRAQASMLKKCGINVVILKPNKDGIITSDNVMEHLTADTTLVCVMAVNNETGVIEPIQEIASSLSQVKGRRVRLHSDCVQAIGKVPLNLQGIDSAAFSAHKICGARAIGLLYMAESMHIEPFLCGGGQEKGIRSGTENVAGAMSFSKCLSRYAIGNGNEAADNRYAKQCTLTNDFIKHLIDIPTCRIIPDSRAYQATKTPLTDDDMPHFSPWIVQAAFMGIPGPVMLRALDAMGYCISTGSACSSKKDGRPVLDAMGVPPDIKECAVRFSFGPHTTAKGMEDLANAVQDIVSRFR